MSSINEIQNDKIKSTMIKVETLQKEYEVTLQQYQEAGKNYINSLHSSISSSTNTTSTYPNKSVFTALKGRTWWGTSKLSEGTVSTQKECENMCANSDKCSGATFNPVKRYCWTRTGDSDITLGIDTDYALITKQKASLSVMKYLNQKLLDLNQLITTELKKIYPAIKNQDKDSNLKQQQLTETYGHLIEQKIELDKQFREYESIEQEEENQGLYVSQQNTAYRFWIIITCLVVLITLRQVFGFDNLPIPIIMWIVIIIVLIILTYSLSTPSGFVMLGILLFIIILIKSGNLQTS